jgi:hypothetical protein
MRFTLLSGFSYGVRIKLKLPKREKKKTPFSY